MASTDTKTMTATQTLTRYATSYGNGTTAKRFGHKTVESAVEWVTRYCPAELEAGTVTVERVETTVQVGTPVTVHAYGRTRGGIVTKLGRTRVAVEFVRNQAGDRDERAFGPTEVEAQDTALETRTQLDPRTGQALEEAACQADEDDELARRQAAARVPGYGAAAVEAALERRAAERQAEQAAAIIREHHLNRDEEKASKPLALAAEDQRCTATREDGPCDTRLIIDRKAGDALVCVNADEHQADPLTRLAAVPPGSLVDLPFADATGVRPVIVDSVILGGADGRIAVEWSHPTFTVEGLTTYPGDTTVRVLEQPR